MASILCKKQKINLAGRFCLVVEIQTQSQIYREKMIYNLGLIHLSIYAKANFHGLKYNPRTWYQPTKNFYH